MRPQAGRRLALAGLALAALGVHAKHHTDAAERPLRIIVPQAPGGAADSMVRLLGNSLAKLGKRPVVVENRSGGGTVTGTLALAMAPPDGDTIGLVLSPHAINQAMRRQMPYHALNDFEPVCLGGYSVTVLAAHPSLAADDVRELLALAGHSKPELQYASLGVGSASHLAGELLCLQAGVEMQHVPFNGSAQIYRSLLGGEIKLAYVTLDSALPHVQAGRLKLLGVTSAQRIPLYPQYPTIAESLPGFEVIGFFGFLAPARTPADVVSRLYDSISAVLHSPLVASRLAEMAVVVTVRGPEEFEAFLRHEITKYKALAQRTGIRIE